MASEPKKASNPGLEDDALYSVELKRTITVAGVEFRPSHQNVQMKGHFIKLAQSDDKNEGAIGGYAQVTG